jgi:two-component system, OmpR family, sensor histidine kinase BaeS
MPKMIRWFNRISVRLVLSMMFVALLSIVIMFVSTNYVVQQQFARIEPDIRSQINNQSNNNQGDNNQNNNNQGDNKGDNQNNNSILSDTNTLSPTSSSNVNVNVNVNVNPDNHSKPPRVPSAPDVAFGVVLPKNSPAPTQNTSSFGVNMSSDLSDNSTRGGRRFRSILNGSSYRNELLLTIGLAALLSVALGGGLAWLLARRIARPLVAVSDAATQIYGGNFTARAKLTPLEQGSHDEATLLARNFNQMAQSLQNLETERKNLIADIAHELRTPLTILQSRLDAYEDGIVPLSLEEMGKLSLQTQLLTRLVEDLRVLSLAEAGRLTIRKRSLEMGNLLEDVLLGFSERFAAKNIKLHFQTPAALWINADPDRLTQVLVNLLNNALRHTPEGGWVRLELISKNTEQKNGEQKNGEQKNGELLLSLTDSGQGISPENLGKVFNRFFRESEERNRESGGTGLGLSIVKTLLELHGGRVEASNAKGAGAQFRVYLPLHSSGVV